MDLRLSYIITSSVLDSLVKIETTRELLKGRFFNHGQIEALKTKALLSKISFFSTLIQRETGYFGLDLSSTQILRVYKWIEKQYRFYHKFQLKDLVNLHKILFSEGAQAKKAGVFRNFEEEGASLAPSAEIKIMSENLVRYLNNPFEKYLPVKACLGLYNFLYISPFTQGNWLCAWYLYWSILIREDKLFADLYDLREGMDIDRMIFLLELEKNGFQEFLEYFLKENADRCLFLKTFFSEKKALVHQELSLLPRRQKLLELIRQNKELTLVKIKKNFPGVEQRSLRYDLAALHRSGLILKKGVTKGVVYTSIS